MFLRASSIPFFIHGAIYNSKKKKPEKISLKYQSIISSDGVQNIKQNFSRGRVEIPKNPEFNPN